MFCSSWDYGVSQGGKGLEGLQLFKQFGIGLKGR